MLQRRVVAPSSRVNIAIKLALSLVVILNPVKEIRALSSKTLTLPIISKRLAVLTQECPACHAIKGCDINHFALRVSRIALKMS